MPYIKIVDNVVIQKQPNEESGFVQAPDSVVCGQVHDGSNSYEEGNFSNPAPAAKTFEDVKKLQRSMIVAHNDLREIHLAEVAHENTAEADYTISPAQFQELLDYFKVIRSLDEANYPDDPDAAISALEALELPAFLQGE